MSRTFFMLCLFVASGLFVSPYLANQQSDAEDVAQVLPAVGYLRADVENDRNHAVEQTRRFTLQVAFGPEDIPERSEVLQSFAFSKTCQTSFLSADTKYTLKIEAVSLDAERILLEYEGGINSELGQANAGGDVMITKGETRKLLVVGGAAFHVSLK